MAAGLVFARMRACACPATPHAEGDGVWLRPTLGLVDGLRLEQEYDDAIAAAVRRRGSIEEVTTTDVDRELTAVWFPSFVRIGACGWNLTGAKRKPVPFDVEAVLDDYALARPVADAAADLYRDTVIVPLVTRRSGTSPDGSTDASTSPPEASTPPPHGSSSPATSGDSTP